MLLIMLAIGVGAWALGRTQIDGGPGPGGGAGGDGVPPQGNAHSHPQSNGYAGGAAPGQGPTPNGGPAAGAGATPKSGWQRPTPPPGGAGTYAAGGTPGAASGAAKGAWERAREETKKKEEERKATEAEKKRKEDMEKRLKEAREKEARERVAREALAKEREKDAREREVREKAGRENQSKGSAYAYSAMGEKTNPWPRGSPAASPTKKPPAPTAKTYHGTDEETYSFRPYDTPPKKPAHMKSPSSVYSESSYAASHSTARTTPPPSHRGPYSTKDPDKIVLKAVYSFNNQFIKTPSSQLISGVGTVTDGLILRITTEGLFIDDDVRGVPQREWDVKAWTMKLVEVWCPSLCQGPAGQSASARVAFNSLKHNPVRRLWGMDKEKAATSEETDALLVDMLQLCRDNCRLSSRATAASASSASASSFDDRSSVASDSAYGSSVGSPSPRNRRTNGAFSQTGELNSARLHVLRASIRDQDGKKYLFVIGDEESWKIAVGLQRLRKGSQVRALGVSGMSAGDARSTLENLGWG